MMLNQLIIKIVIIYTLSKIICIFKLRIQITPTSYEIIQKSAVLSYFVVEA